MPVAKKSNRPRQAGPGRRAAKSTRAQSPRPQPALRGLHEALLRAQAEARTAAITRDHCIATLAHELRTPLTATLLWAKLLNQQQDPDPAMLREGLAAIEQSAGELQAIIDSVIDLSHLITGKLRLRPARVDLAALVHSAVEMIRPSTLEKELQLETAADPRAGLVLADACRLQQILGNLLGNAVKFTPAQGRISVRLRRQGRTVTIEVADTGRGIAPEFLEKIFERFAQGAGPGDDISGLGLGLFIARQLAERHGGSLVAASDGPGKGAVFTLRLPLPRLRPEKTAAAGTPAPTGGP